MDHGYNNEIRSNLNADTSVMTQAHKDSQKKEVKRNLVLSKISPLSCHKVLNNIA
jgi:capsid portal protein